MSSVIEAGPIGQLLEAAAKVMTEVRYCWLVTATAEVGCTARPMGRILHVADTALWTVRFITDHRSQKAREIEQAASAQLIFQHPERDAFVTMSGEARLQSDVSTVQRLWKESYNSYFPQEDDRANATFIEVAVDHMRLWIRDVTPEPFGVRPVVLERDSTGKWRAVEPEPGKTICP